MIKTEEEIAEAAEGLMAAHLGIHPGDRTRNDAAKGRLRVDFTYENAKPHPLALEVTSLTRGHFHSAFAEANRHNTDLPGAAHRAQPAVIDEYTLVKELDPTIPIAAVRSGPRSVGGCTSLLNSVVLENCEKLAEAQPRSTHLAIWVERLECSPDPSLTAVPDANQAIDWIWVLFRLAPKPSVPAFGLDGRPHVPPPDPWVWWSSPGEMRWESLAATHDRV